MATLKKAHQELYRRSPDETFSTLPDLISHCVQQKEQSNDLWKPPAQIVPDLSDGQFGLKLADDGAYHLNDWSFTQLCGLARVNKETVNRLSPETISRVFRETLPTGNKPLQLLASRNTVRSIHGVTYTRLWNADLLSVAHEFAGDFTPPQTADGGGTGLYAGEQDMFVFLIDPSGWTEINGQAFAPGCFLWNSEVGRRSVGVSTFWFQKVCANHIVWDATEVVEFSRKHTANVHEALVEIRRTLERLVASRDARRDGFASVMRKAMQERLGSDADEVLEVLGKKGVGRRLARQALDIAQEQGAFTIFSVVDALTRLAGSLPFAGERLQAEVKAASLLELVA